MDDNELNICKSINSLSIVKVILKNPGRNDNHGHDHSNPSKKESTETKLIFVGYRSDNIKTILAKLEKHQKISDKENRELETAIPNYRKKFGTLEHYNVYFVYKYIEENLPLKHFKTLLFETIKNYFTTAAIDTNGSYESYESYYPHHMLIYKYSRTINYKYYINIINYIFENEHTMDNKAFFSRLYKLTFMDKSEISQNIKSILADKYKSIPATEIEFINHETYNYNDYLYNDDLYHLILNIPNIISIKYNYNFKETIHNYYGYQHIIQLLNHITTETNRIDRAAKDAKDIKDAYQGSSDKEKEDTNDQSSKGDDNDNDNRKIRFFLEYNLNNDSDYNDGQTLSYFNKTVNNEYFILSYADLKPILTKTMAKFYFPDAENEGFQNTRKLESTNREIYNHLRLNTIRKHIYNDEIMSIGKCYCRNIVFDSLSDDINIKYNLDNIYNNISTNYHLLPVIKYFRDGEFKYIKINKNFLQKHSYQEINKLLVSNDLLTIGTKLITNTMNYIQYKWRISKDIIITINFYENGYSIIYFNDEQNLQIGKSLFEYLEIVKHTIKMIKKTINAKKLILPNINNVFNEYTDRINYSGLMAGNIIISGKLDIEKLLLKTEITSKPRASHIGIIIERFKKYCSALHHFIITKSANISVIKIFYKQVNNFYSNRSIEQFIYGTLRDLKKTDDNGNIAIRKVDKSLEERLFKQCRDIFLIDDTHLTKIYKNIENYNSKIAEKLLYGIEVEIKIDNDGTLEIKIENVDRYHSVRLILFYIKSVFSNIANDVEHETIDTETSLKSQNHSSDDSKTSIGKGKSNGKGISISKGKIKEKSRDLEEDRDDLFDFNLDMDLNLDIDLDLDLSIKMDEDDKDILGHGMPEIDNVENMDLRDLARLIQIDKLPVEGEDKGDRKLDARDGKGGKGDQDIELKNLELLKFQGKDKKLSFTKYMSQMREKYDKPLFNPEALGANRYEYNRACQATVMRQPYIISKKDIESFDDPEAFNGYLKYRGNYYICPRIWDWLANKPISVRRFIENKLKSPYTNGTYIPPEERTKIYLDESRTVIIRKHKEWEDPDKNKDWPEILKKTEKEAFPYLKESPDHPQKLCVPCCGIKKPEDFDINKKEIQQIMRPMGYKECKYTPEEEEEVKKEGGKDERGEHISCVNNIEKYITNETSELEKCRFGLLPRNLDIMLNNHQNLFLTKSQNELLNNASLFLRRGIDVNKKDNILESFAVIFNKSLTSLKNLIITKLTPEVFISLNNGELIDIYSSNNILPNSLNDYDKFAFFMRNYLLFFNILDIDYSILERVKFKDVEILKIHIEDNTSFQNYIGKLNKDSKDSKDSKTITRKTEVEDLKKLIMAYKIYTAFYNYIGHILDDNEYKNYTHFLDLFSKPIEWLNKEGANILIFDQTCSKLTCNPYTNITRSRFMIMIREDDHHFVPVVHVNNLNKNIGIDGIFQITKINITESLHNYFEKRTTNKKLLHLTKYRDDAIINLVLLHSNICKYQVQQMTTNLIKDLDEIDIRPIKQLALSTTQIEFIKLDDNYNHLLLPIYPSAIDAGAKGLVVKFKFLEEGDMVSIDHYIKMKSTDIMKTLYDKLAQYNYKISKIFYDEMTNLITSVQFINNLIVPVASEKKTIMREREIIKMMITEGELKNEDDPRITSLFRPGYFDFRLELSPEINILNLRNLIYKDFIYNYFKYDFSRILQENTFRNEKTDLETLMKDYNKKVRDFQDVLDEIYNQVFKIMNKRIRNSGAGAQKVFKDNIKLKVCKKTKKQGKCASHFCEYNEADKQCYLDMSADQLEYFAYLIANDLLNNKMESREIITGSFIPEFNMRNKIFRNPDEININTEELASIIESGIYSKFKKNITLSEYLNNEEEYQFMKSDYTILENTNMEQFKKIMNTIIPDVVDLSIKNIFIDDKILTTPFNKSGTYDNHSNVGECKFPFFDKNRTKYVYQCMPRTQGVMCPTKIDYQRKPDKWGYCPEKIDETKKSLKVIEVDTVGDNKNYYKGRCLSPHMVKESGTHSPEYKLKYNCIEETDKELGNYAWCPLKNPVSIPGRNLNGNKASTRKIIPNKPGTLKQGPENKALIDELDNQHEGDLLRAADKFENVHMNKWYDGKLTPAGITSKKHLKGYCQPPLPIIKPKKPTPVAEPIEAILDKGKAKGVEKVNGLELGAVMDEDDKGMPELTLDNYIPNNCSASFTPSKGGYSRPQLKRFGVNYLKIPYTELMKNDETDLQKADMCRIINNKYREIKTQGRTITDADRINAYSKNIDNCEDGESKGGYSLKELREIAINYFDMDEQTAKDINKDKLCYYVRKRLKKINAKTDADVAMAAAEAIPAKGSRKEKPVEESEKDLSSKGEQTISGVSAGLSMIYPMDINLCKETPNRGGPGSKEIKQIARDNFGIDTEHKHKDEICDEIESKLKKGRKDAKKQGAKAKETMISPSQIRKVNFDELFENPNAMEIPFIQEDITDLDDGDLDNGDLDDGDLDIEDLEKTIQQIGISSKSSKSRSTKSKANKVNKANKANTLDDEEL
jgi:hypothetical protein